MKTAQWDVMIFEATEHVAKLRNTLNSTKSDEEYERFSREIVVPAVTRLAEFCAMVDEACEVKDTVTQ